jgi:hypothetical protein
MLLQTMLGLKEDVYLIESSFEGLEMNLKTLDYLDKLSQLPEGSVQSAIMIEYKDGTQAGVAFKNRYDDSDFWFVVPYPASNVVKAQIEKLVKAVFDADIVISHKKKKVDPLKFRLALREYLSMNLMESNLCDCERGREPKSFAFNEARNSQISALLKNLARKNGIDLKKTEALEICCGNGMSTAAVRPLFKNILSIDNDRCAVCDGLYYGILEPSNTMVIDARELAKYLDRSYDAVLGFMLGAIYEFNKEIWRTIFKRSYNALKEGGFILLTVNNKEEMDFLAEAFQSMGVDGTVIDNRNDSGIYDGWAFFAMK